MYNYPGEYVTDFCITRRDGIYHLFHIRGERWTWPVGYREIDLGHAISTDMRLWTPQPPVLPAGPAGAWDEAGVWAPDIIERDGLYYIFYTGADRKVNQKIGLATSTDIYHWTKHPENPVVAPGPWSDRARGQQVAGRDAMVFSDTRHDRYLMYYTATLADGHPCIALAASQDLVHWEDMGPTYIEEDLSYNRCESAYLVQHEDKYYLFYSAKGGPQSKGHSPESFAHFDIVYLVSDDPTGGWTKPYNHELLKAWTCASEHPTFDGTTYMFYVVQEEVEGIWGASVLSDPKIVTWRQDGSIKIVEHVPDNVGQRKIFAQRDKSVSDWVQRPGAFLLTDDGVLHAQAADQDAYLINPLWGQDIVVEAEFQLSAGGIGSLMVRCNPSGTSGYRFSLDPDRNMFGLYMQLFNQPARLIQERAVNLSSGDWHKLKIVVQGKFLDAYVDDELLLVRTHSAFEEGCFGVHTRGDIAVRDLHAYEYLGPEKLISRTWSRRAEPRHLFP